MFARFVLNDLVREAELRDKRFGIRTETPPTLLSDREREQLVDDSHRLAQQMLAGITGGCDAKLSIVLSRSEGRPDECF